ncbi:MAG TPA: hypothetical protein VG817_02185 [Gemmatimonadales bacterium]|nr:hypothetical protein [Gemmatimonadales bacterium]
MRALAVFAVLAGVLAGVSPVAAQDEAVRLQVYPDSAFRPRVRTTGLLTDERWLTALRQGLPVQLSYKIELWRSQSGPDGLVRSYEFRVVVRHEPLLDQFSVYRLFPGQSVRNNVYPTPGTLGAALALVYQIPMKPEEGGSYYYAASMSVSTLSDSDLENFNKTIRGEITSGSGTSLAERARRLLLILAGLPKLDRSARSESFVVK